MRPDMGVGKKRVYAARHGMVIKRSMIAICTNGMRPIYLKRIILVIFSYSVAWYALSVVTKRSMRYVGRFVESDGC